MSRDLRLDVSGIDLDRLRSAVKAPGMFLFSSSVCPALGEPARLTAAAGLNSGIADGMNDRALVNRIFLGSRITALYEPDGHAYTSVQHGGGWVEFQPIDPRQGPLAFWLITKRIAAERARPRLVSVPSGGFELGLLSPWRLRGFRGRNPIFWRPFLLYGWQDDEHGQIRQVALCWTWSPRKPKASWIITRLDHHPISFVLPARPAEKDLVHHCKDWDPGARIPPEMQERLNRLNTPTTS